MKTNSYLVPEFRSPLILSQSANLDGHVLSA